MNETLLSEAARRYEAAATVLINLSHSNVSASVIVAATDILRAAAVAYLRLL